MVGEQADRHQQDDVPNREGGESADGVLERRVHHRVLDLVGEPLRDEVRQEIVEIAEQENRQRDQHHENAEEQLGPGDTAADHPVVKAGFLQQPCVLARVSFTSSIIESENMLYSSIVKLLLV